MQLAAPPGYQSVVLLDKQKHSQRGVRPFAARFARSLNAVYVTCTEFIAAGRYYPVVFGRDAADRLQPLAVVGLEPGQNLAVDAAGDWRAGEYCPAYVRRYPFCTAELAESGVTKSVICVDEAGLSAEPPHLFDARGNATPRWREIQRLIEEIEAARVRTDEFCRRIAALDLLEEFDADINPALGPRKRLTGMFRVVEARLHRLAPDSIVSLLQTGALARIHAHLMSLDNFHRLLQVDLPRVADHVAVPPEQPSA